MSRRTAYVLAASGAALWGIIGLFVNELYRLGFTPWEVVGLRVTFSAAMMVVFLLLFHRQHLRIQWQDTPYFIGTGIISIVFFNWCYFTVIDEASLSLAVVLLYTGPLFVTVLSRIFFREWLTTRKMIALLCTLTGCAFAVELLPQLDVQLSGYVLIIGIGSGFFYALYSIFGKKLTATYSALTIPTYSFIMASLFMIPTSSFWRKSDVWSNPEVWFWSIGLAFVPTVLGYILYTRGLSQVESSRAAILSTIEPVVAIGIGVSLLGDVLSVWQMAGIGLVLASIILAAEKKATYTESKAK